jgi:hypothetical protein
MLRWGPSWQTLVAALPPPASRFVVRQNAEVCRRGAGPSMSLEEEGALGEYTLRFVALIKEGNAAALFASFFLLPSPTVSHGSRGRLHLEQSGDRGSNPTTMASPDAQWTVLFWPQV